MTAEARDSVVDPDALFVVACPLCQGHVAAIGSLCGHDVCCPLCANLFHVPFPAAETVVTDSTDEQAEDADGWDEMAGLPGGGPEAAGAGEEAAAALAATIIPAEQPSAACPATAPVDPAVAHADEAPPAAASAPLRQPAADSPALRTPAAPQATSGPAAESTARPDPTAIAAAIGGPALPPPIDVDVVVLPDPAAAGPPPSAKQMVFTEPVRTIRQGGQVIELRRLTPEERRTRRFRRNVMMIVVGVSILLVIVLIFGVPAGRR